MHWIANLRLARNERKRTGWGEAGLMGGAIRLLPLAPVLGTGWFAVLVLEPVFFFLRPQSYQATRDALRPLHLLAGISLLCPMLTMFRLRSLAMRMNRPRLAEHIGIVAIGSAASLVLYFGGLGIETRHADVMFYAMKVLPEALVALFSLWSVFVLFWICPQFYAAAAEAKARWRAADASLGNHQVRASDHHGAADVHPRLR